MKLRFNFEVNNVDDKDLDLKKMSANDIQIMKLDDVWDGPLSGICKWNGESYYFHYFDLVDQDSDSDNWPRKFMLINLNKYSEIPDTVDIELNQVVGWFDSGAPGEENTFMKSYADLIKV